MIQATGGSLYNRSLVHPDYKDFGPRVGLAYSADSKTVVRSGYGISYSFFNRPGSALEGINAPNALFGVLSQSIPSAGKVPSTFLTTVNSFTTGIANPSAFNPLNQTSTMSRLIRAGPIFRTGSCPSSARSWTTPCWK